jgi:hypothetical protein
MDEDQLKLAIDAMFEVKHKQGDVIISQGDNGDNFYVVQSGTCDTFVKYCNFPPLLLFFFLFFSLPSSCCLIVTNRLLLPLRSK